MSDETGQFFTTSLFNVTNLQFLGGFIPDVYEVRGIQGVFIANRITRSNGAETVITFDKGGQWEKIASPSKLPYSCKVSDSFKNRLN